MCNRATMVKFFTQICPKISKRSISNIAIPHQCLVLTKERLTELKPYSKHVYQSRTFAEGPSAKGPDKVEQIETIKMPGFVHPQSKHEEGYFTQKAQQQLEELKKKIEKPKVDNTEKQE